MTFPQLEIFDSPQPSQRNTQHPHRHIPPDALLRIADPLALNEDQLAIITSQRGPSLVLAGAGTGKTNVLTRRAAWLIANGLQPKHVLLITFTRKAAAEMLRRVQELNPLPHLKIQGGTFHSMASAWLREHAHAIKLNPRFTVMDEGEAATMLHLLASKLHLLKIKGFPDKRSLLSLFGHAANSLTSLPTLLEADYPQYTPHLTAISTLHRSFVDTKRAQQRFDYDDLLLLVYELLNDHPQTAIALTQQYKAVLIDEYQDTTHLQAEIVRLLAEPHQNVMVVGDPAQSIYSFRAADVQNMDKFRYLFPSPTVHTLQRNYRSTQPILTLANQVLHNAPHGYQQRLHTTKTKGLLPHLVECSTEQAQSSFVIARVRQLQHQGLGLHRIAILVRSSAHSYDLETELAHQRLPFVKYGGLALVETGHVKDFLAYLTLTTKPTDTQAWQRILFLIDCISTQYASTLIRQIQSTSQPLTVLTKHSGIIREALSTLHDMLQTLSHEDIPLPLRLQQLLDYYQPLLARHYPADAPERMAELSYLVQCHRDTPSYDAFITALTKTGTSDRNQSPDHPADSLVISTIHSAKGLEWDAVMLINAADGWLPLNRATQNPYTLEEERRLLYVAITRAKYVLDITYPVERRCNHSTTGKRSRFLEGLDHNTIEFTQVPGSGSLTLPAEVTAHHSIRSLPKP